MSKRYSVLGLGKLGASMAAAIAQQGHEVIGVDINEESVRRVNAGEAPVQETDLDATIAANRERLRATLDQEEAILGSDLTFVIVPTPSDTRGLFSLQYAKWAFRGIGKALAKKQGYHNIVLTSTVLPGSTRYGLLPILESESGKRCGPDFGLCYSPEFIALGSVIKDFLNPDFTLIGEFDERSGADLEESYRGILANGAPAQRMSLENAELAKVAVNSFVTTKITYANTLARICEQMPGGDVDVVTRAIGLDSRIGRKYLTGGVSYGGPCFPRDNVALSAFARACGVPAELADTTHTVNEAYIDHLTQSIMARTGPEDTVALLGLAYKPHSHVVEESPGVKLMQRLIDLGVRVIGYDPLAGDGARQEVHGKGMIFSELQSCVKQADAIVVMTPDPAFAALRHDDLKRADKPVVVFDTWRFLKDSMAADDAVDYVAIGVGGQPHDESKQLELMWGA